MNNFNWDEGFQVDFDLADGLSKMACTSKRTLRQMRDMFLDTHAADLILETGNPVIYEFYELGCPEREGDLAFGTTILHPGKVGKEYYMTKGHFHKNLETAEVYYTLAGCGCMVMENQKGNTIEIPLSKGAAAYVPRGYAHRTVNTGKDSLVLFYTFAADAGHDYKTIETRGYRKLVVEEKGSPCMMDNPRRRQDEV